MTKAFITGGSGFVGCPCIRAMLENVSLEHAQTSPPITRTRVWLTDEEVRLDGSKAREQLGYAPVISREHGLIELRA
jgi:nucleoside-diphosphate-sugar epimerase